MADSLVPLPASFTETRAVLHVVATHVVARARHRGTGRFGLRASPGGFGTPAFGPQVERVRVSGSRLLRELAGPDGVATSVAEIDGATLADLARVAGVDLAAPFAAGADTPELGDVTVPVHVDGASAEALGAWYHFAAAVLDDVVAGHATATPSVAQLWPEHFDLALDLEAAPGVRVNIGASPGDSSHPDPYLYVGPWTADRPGDDGYWNAPFGAVLGYEDLRQAAEHRPAAAAFIERGLQALGTVRPT